MFHSKVLLIVTGSISVYKSLDLVSKLRKSGYEVKVVMTKSAQKFVSPLSFSSLSGNSVYTDLFDTHEPMNHIELERWADKIIVAPATANFINKIAGGVADDLASNLYLAHEFSKPFIIYPAMNSAMLNHPETQSNLAKLQNYGITVGETSTGELACGEVGAGKLLDIDKIYSQITQEKSVPLKILITSGGTKEPIDGVRHLGNMSSGNTGRVIAESLIGEGHNITFIHARGSKRPKGGALLKEFTSFDSLNNALESELTTQHYDYVIHLAAISDFSVDYLKSNEGIKLDPSEKLSSDSEFSIHLKKNFKILSKLKKYSRNKSIKIIAFKLTHTSDLEKRKRAIKKVFNNEAVEYVVHNDLSDISIESHKFVIHSQSHKTVMGNTKKDLAFILKELLVRGPKRGEVRV